MIDYRLAGEALNRKPDYSFGNRVMEGMQVIDDSVDRQRLLDQRALQDQQRQKMQTFGDFVSGQYASGNPNRDLIISEYAKVNPGEALDAAGFGNNFGRKSIESKELREKQEAHAIEAGRIRKLAEQYSLDYDTASKEENSEAMEKARQNYISNYNTYIQEIEPLFAPLKFTSYQQKPYTIKPFSQRLEDDKMRAIKQQTAQAKQTTAEAAAANVGVEREKLKASAEKQKLETEALRKDKTEGNTKQKIAAKEAAELIRLNKIISEASTSDIWKSKLGIPTKLTSASNLFVEAILRAKSGAAISIPERFEEKSSYIPVVTDFGNKSVLDNKSQYRASLINRVIAGAGPAWKGGDYTAPTVKRKGSKKALFEDSKKSTTSGKRKMAYNPKTRRIEYVD